MLRRKITELKCEECKRTQQCQGLFCMICQGFECEYCVNHIKNYKLRKVFLEHLYNSAEEERYDLVEWMKDKPDKGEEPVCKPDRGEGREVAEAKEKEEPAAEGSAIKAILRKREQAASTKENETCRKCQGTTVGKGEADVTDGTETMRSGPDTDNPWHGPIATVHDQVRSGIVEAFDSINAAVREARKGKKLKTTRPETNQDESAIVTTAASSSNEVHVTGGMLPTSPRDKLTPMQERFWVNAVNKAYQKEEAMKVNMTMEGIMKDDGVMLISHVLRKEELKYPEEALLSVIRNDSMPLSFMAEYGYIENNNAYRRMLNCATAKNRKIIGGKFKWDEWMAMEKRVKELLDKKYVIPSSETSMWGGILDKEGKNGNLTSMRFTFKAFAMMLLVQQQEPGP